MESTTIAGERCSDPASLFATLMAQHKGIIYKITNAYCQQQDDRQDLAQEILTTLWLAFDNYDRVL